MYLSTPPPHILPALACPAKLPIVDPDTQEVLLWVDDRRARDMIKAGKARYLRTKKRIYGLALIDQRRSSQPQKPTSLRKRGVGDSHRQERNDNPEGVWTIDRIGKNKRPLFLGVLLSCASDLSNSRKRAA